MTGPTPQEARAREIVRAAENEAHLQGLIAAALTREYEAGVRAERDRCATLLEERAAILTAPRIPLDEDLVGAVYLRQVAAALHADDATPPTKETA